MATTPSQVTGFDGTPLVNDSLWSFEANAHRHTTTDGTGSFSLSPAMERSGSISTRPTTTGNAMESHIYIYIINMFRRRSVK